MPTEMDGVAKSGLRIARTREITTSVRAAAGWSSGAMVARYTSALSGELAVEEFRRIWK
jgi:hypothetical protein